MNPVILGMNVLNPLCMQYDDEWMLIAEYSNPEEYDALDDLFRYLTGDIPRCDLLEDMRSKSDKELHELYEKRFAVLFGKVLQEVDKELAYGEIKLNIDYTIPKTFEA